MIALLAIAVTHLVSTVFQQRRTLRLYELRFGRIADVDEGVQTAPAVAAPVDVPAAEAVPEPYYEGPAGRHGASSSAASSSGTTTTGVPRPIGLAERHGERAAPTSASAAPQTSAAAVIIDRPVGHVQWLERATPDIWVFPSGHAYHSSFNCQGGGKKYKACGLCCNSRALACYRCIAGLHVTRVPPCGWPPESTDNFVERPPEPYPAAPTSTSAGSSSRAA